MKITSATALTAALAVSAPAVTAEEIAPEAAKEHSAVDVRFGVSPFLGVLSVEYQKGHYGFGLGLPGHAAVSYYRRPGEDSAFYSASLAYVNFHNTDDYEDGFYYTDNKMRGLSVGGGYRWLWSSGWNVAASAALSYSKNTYSNDSYYSYSYMKKQTLQLALGVAVGYAF